MVGEGGVPRMGLPEANGDKLKLSLVDGELGCLGLSIVGTLFIIYEQPKDLVYSYAVRKPSSE